MIDLFLADSSHFARGMNNPMATPAALSAPT
jgi:hypothetical protein